METTGTPEEETSEQESDTAQCDGWKDTAHRTHYSIAAIEFVRGLVRLCRVCAIDCYNDMKLPEEERDAAKAAFDAMYKLMSQDRVIW